MRTTICLLSAILLLAARIAPAAAIDPLQVDIIGLRLGMALPDVLRCLARQGIDRSRIHLQAGACGHAAGTRCTRRLAAPTVDGSLVVRFRASGGPGSETVSRIAYTLIPRGDPATIEGAVLDHFGPPTTSHPLTWCASGDRSGCDPPNQPRLTFVEGPEATSTLTLSDPPAAGGP